VTPDVTEKIMRLRSELSAAGLGRAGQGEIGRRCPGLGYHHIGPSRPGTYRALTVSPEQFERQIRWLAGRGYVGIRPSDWLRARKENTELPAKPILITFDDAYEDTAEYALPILRRFGFGAAVFVVTERIGGTNTWDEAKGCGRLQLMTEEQIRYWSGEGIEFGAHSRTHVDLTKLPASELMSEVAGSRDDLSALLGLPIVSFAYPYGGHNQAVRDFVAGHFDVAFSGEEGPNYVSGDPYLLRRAFVSPDDSLIEFALGVRWCGIQRFRGLRARIGVRGRVKTAARRVLSFAVRCIRRVGMVWRNGASLD
jgi:peptidoglycan/xylan/chitin deacetylase (PgdA/CDA1 family)